MKKLLLGFTLLLLLYLLYNFGVRTYLDKYNDSQWAEYVSYWEQVKEQAQPIIACKNSLIQNMNAIEPLYIDALTNDSTPKSVEQRYHESLYKNLRGIVSGLESELSYYEQDQPEIEGGLFFYTNSSYEPITPWDIQRRKQKTIENLAYYKDNFQNYETNKIANLYCPKLDNASFTYPMNKKLCTELMTYYIRRSTPPSRDNFDLDIEYQKALDKFNDTVTTQLNYCDDLETVQETPSMYFNEIHW